MGAKKQGKKGNRKYQFCHWWEWYMNKLGKLKQPAHVKKNQADDNLKNVN